MILRSYLIDSTSKFDKFLIAFLNSNAALLRKAIRSVESIVIIPVRQSIDDEMIALSSSTYA